jgi:hypothetical protein
LSDTVRQRSSSNFSVRYFARILFITLIFSYIQVVPMKCD